MGSEPLDLEAAKAVVDVLRGRKGFGYWWNGIDPDTQAEILDELAGFVSAAEVRRLREDYGVLESLYAGLQGAFSGLLADRNEARAELAKMRRDGDPALDAANLEIARLREAGKKVRETFSAFDDANEPASLKKPDGLDRLVATEAALRAAVEAL